MCGQHMLTDGEKIHDKVTIPYGRAWLASANDLAFQCENILQRGANAKYIVEHEFAPFFEMVRKTLGPLVYGDDWKGPR